MELKVIKAIDESNLNELERLLKINDLLHKGMPEYAGFKQDEMLTDIKYEEALSFLREQRSLEIALTSKVSDEFTDTRKASENTLMFMDGIQITDTIPEITDVVLMPKFDGCSVGCEIIKSSSSFVISKAHTRGTDNLNGTRKCQDKTTYIQEVSVSMMDRFNKIISDKNKNLQIKLHYKNTELTGNENEPLTTKIDLHDLDYMLIRGEFVSNNKDHMKNENLPSTAVGLAAGALNAKVDKFNEYKEYIDYIPFEISLIKICTDDKVMTYVPTQESALKIMKTLEMIDYKFYAVDKLDEKYNMEHVLCIFESNTKQPLDGVVYCKKNWTYPVLAEETSKRVNYGKYKWKRHNVKQTKLRSIEYSIGKTGKLTPSFIFDGVMINNKNYKQAKTTFNHIQEYIDECSKKNVKFGEGLICELELMSDISPQITRIFPQISHISNEIIPLSTCPYCGKELVTETKTVAKQRVINVSCEYQKCKGVLAQKCCDFLKQIGYKGINYKTLENMNYKHFFMLYNEKLAKEYREVGIKEKIIYSAKSVRKNKPKIDFDDLVMNMNMQSFLINTSLFTKGKAPAFLEEMGLNGMDNFVSNINTEKYKELLAYLKYKTNFFIKDLVTFLIEHYSITQ